MTNMDNDITNLETIFINNTVYLLNMFNNTNNKKIKIEITKEIFKVIDKAKIVIEIINTIETHENVFNNSSFVAFKKIVKSKLLEFMKEKDQVELIAKSEAFIKEPVKVSEPLKEEPVKVSEPLKEELVKVSEPLKEEPVKVCEPFKEEPFKVEVYISAYEKLMKFEQLTNY
jgi:hypothetical protein